MTTIHSDTSARNVFLIGFMGCGKSTIASELSASLNRPVLEMDEEIERREGMSISEIFSLHGEPYFREAETSLLKETSSRGGFLVSCGGGAAMRSENVQEMKKNGIIILLTALPETILSRVADDENRPLLKNHKNICDISALIQKRKPAYEAAADYSVTTDNRSARQIADEILEILEKEGMLS
ncbi:MAG: shikimate kinase [Lachnospiraceae bacterium]|nr:shikimate kinase [Lachnospiraceae bacterium]